MLGLQKRDVAFGTRWCFHGLCITSSTSGLFHCRFLLIAAHTSCWACDSLFFKKTRFAMQFLPKSVLLGLDLREQHLFSVAVSPFQFKR